MAGGAAGGVGGMAAGVAGAASMAGGAAAMAGAMPGAVGALGSAEAEAEADLYAERDPAVQRMLQRTQALEDLPGIGADVPAGAAELALRQVEQAEGVPGVPTNVLQKLLQAEPAECRREQLEVRRRPPRAMLCRPRSRHCVVASRRRARLCRGRTACWRPWRSAGGWRLPSPRRARR